MFRQLFYGIWLTGLCCALSAQAAVSNDKRTRTPASAAQAPSRAAYPGCRWERVKGAGLEFWGQRCKWKGRPLTAIGISETLPGAYVVENVHNQPVAVGDAIQVIALPNRQIEDALNRVRDYESWNHAEQCAFDAGKEIRPGVMEYVLAPTGSALAAIKAAPRPIPETCAGYGWVDDRVIVFQIHRSAPHKAVVLFIGDSAPLFDEKSVTVKP